MNHNKRLFLMCGVWATLAASVTVAHCDDAPDPPPPNAAASNVDTERITPLTGVWADEETLVASPLIATEPEVTKQRRAIIEQIEPLAKQRIVIRHPLPRTPDIMWVGPTYYEIGKKGDGVRSQYALAGEHLLMAMQLLKSSDAGQQLIGLSLARAVHQQVNEKMKNPRMAAAILRWYVLPEIHRGDAGINQQLSRTGMAEMYMTALTVIDRSDTISPSEKLARLDEYIEAEKLYIGVTTDTGNADYRRWEIAKMLERQGHFAQAMRAIKEIDPQGPHFNAYKELPRLQAKLDAQQKTISKESKHEK